MAAPNPHAVTRETLWLIVSLIWLAMLIGMIRLVYGM